MRELRRWFRGSIPSQPIPVSARSSSPCRIGEIRNRYLTKKPPFIRRGLTRIFNGRIRISIRVHPRQTASSGLKTGAKSGAKAESTLCHRELGPLSATGSCFYPEGRGHSLSEGRGHSLSQAPAVISRSRKSRRLSPEGWGHSLSQAPAAISRSRKSRRLSPEGWGHSLSQRAGTTLCHRILLLSRRPGPLFVTESWNHSLPQDPASIHKAGGHTLSQDPATISQSRKSIALRHVDALATTSCQRLDADSSGCARHRILDGSSTIHVASRLRFAIGSLLKTGWLRGAGRGRRDCPSASPGRHGGTRRRGRPSGGLRSGARPGLSPPCS